MSDIRKVRETLTKDEGDWEEWPYPTVTIESVVSGELRSRIFAVLGRADDGAEVRLVETKVSAGYSEYTQEDECEIEVKIGTETAWKDDYNYSSESAIASFMRHFASQNPITEW